MPIIRRIGMPVVRPIVRAVNEAYRPAGPIGPIVPAPALDLDLTASLDNRVTFTRASGGTRVNEQGLIETVAADTPRFDHDPVTLAPKGLLIEGARTNLVLNSATLATQNVTVTAAAHTLSFYGTGTVTLSGVATGSLVGSGAFPTRSTLTFAPTAGTLTLTVTGSVTLGQLEAGPFASSYIPTTTSQVTRAPDVAVMTGTNFSDWYNQSEGTWFVEGSGANAEFTASRRYFESGDGNNRHILAYTATGQTRYLVTSGGVSQADLFGSNGVAGPNLVKMAAAYKVNDFQASTNGILSLSDAAGTLPSVNRISIGASVDGFPPAYLFGHIRRITYWDTRLPNETLQALTTPTN